MKNNENENENYEPNKTFEEMKKEWKRNKYDYDDYFLAIKINFIININIVSNNNNSNIIIILIISLFLIRKEEDKYIHKDSYRLIHR